MQRIFFRHVLREIALATAAVAVVLLVILVTYQLAFILGRAADGQVPGELVLKIAALSLRSNVTIILPFALLLGTILGLGRLYHESEITAAQACGLGINNLYAAAAVMTGMAGMIVAWITLIDGPTAARDVVQLRSQALRTAVTRGLVPGQFRRIGSGVSLHFRAQDADGSLRKVFIQRDVPGASTGRMEVVVAERARYQLANDNSSYVIHLFDGASHEGVPGRGDWRVLHFKEQTLRIATPDAALPGKSRVDVIPTAELLGATDLRLRAELQWRFGWVLLTLVAGLLAVPLARLQPRQGRYANLLPGVLLFAVYAGLLSVARSAMERGGMSATLGMWWVHASALLLAWALLKIRALRF
jgi:lipopolysaccharide export system permease protein